MTTGQPEVIAVSRSSIHGFSKQQEPCILLRTGEGVEGDAHCGKTVQHLYQKRRDPHLPNLAQVHLFSLEMLEELTGKGFELSPGDLGENVLVRGIDLLGLPLGATLQLGEEAIVKITGLRTPCFKIDHFRPGLQQHLWGERDGSGERRRRAGVMATVSNSGEVRPGDQITLQLPIEPFQPLRPV